MDGKDSLITTLSDKEGLFLKGLLSHHEEERKQAFLYNKQNNNKSYFLFITLENRVSMEEPDKTNENISNTNNSHQPTRESIHKLKHTHTEEKERTKRKNKTFISKSLRNSLSINSF